jgi:hypothetical protein
MKTSINPLPAPTRMKAIQSRPVGSTAIAKAPTPSAIKEPATSALIGKRVRRGAPNVITRTATIDSKARSTPLPPYDRPRCRLSSTTMITQVPQYCPNDQ